MLLLIEYLFLLLLGNIIAAAAYRILSEYAADIPSIYHQQGPPVMISALFVAGMALIALLTNMKMIKSIMNTGDFEYHLDGRG